MPPQYLAFAVPTPHAAGQNGRDPTTRLIDALREAGHRVTQHAIDTPAQAGAWLEQIAAASQATPIIDGVVLPHCAGLGGHLSLASCIGLLHRAPRGAMPILPQLGRIVASSASVAERVQENLPGIAARVVVVPPGTDPAPRAPGSHDGVCRLISVGALQPRKGHHALLQALARLGDLEWRLAIIGDAACDPAHAAMLRAECSAPPLRGRVVFSGNVDAAALAAHWAEADIFVLPSSFEAGFATLGEALRHGLPAVIGVPSAMLPPAAGIVCPQQDPATLSKVLRRLIFDRGLRRAISDAAWQAGIALPDWAMAAKDFVLRGLAGAAQHEVT